MNKIIGLLTFNLLLSCASAPKFETSGYTVTQLTSKNHFEITLKLDSETDAINLKDYALRAIGEECLKKGFEYFDYGDGHQQKYIGFCYLANEKKALALAFSKNELLSNPKKFIVEDLHNKSPTFLKVNDEILSMGGQKLTTMDQIKSLVFVAAQKYNHIPITLIRDNKSLEFNEPFTLFKNSVWGKSELELLRKKVR